MYDSILIAVDGSQYSDWGRAAALELLSPKGRLQFLHVVDIIALEGTFLQDLSGAVGAEPFMNLSPKLEQILREKGMATLDAQIEACKRSGAECHSLLETGIVANVIAHKAVEHRLVVVGRRGKNERFHTGLAGSVTESLLRKSPRPVLVVPAQPRPVTKVLLGYDGSQPSAHAMNEAGRFCTDRNLPLTVLVAGDEAPYNEKLLQTARSFFATAKHPVSFENKIGSPNEVLTAAAANFDLLIVGAHGHSRIVEMIVGSTTEYLLRNAPIPTLFTR
jgi:nucleotide-binding universal stress UspA family protein